MTFKYRLEEKVLGPKPKISGTEAINKDFESAMGYKEVANSTRNRPNREDDRLIEKVGDEIRTPINGIIASVDLLKEGNITVEQLVQLNSITTASKHLVDIVNELLDYTKLTSGKEKFENIEFNFHSIIRDTTYLCNTLITKKNVTLEVDLDTEIPEILLGDPSKLSQILLTLLGNSIKLIDEGSVLLKIKLRKQHGNCSVLDFEIRDVRTETLKQDLKHHESNKIADSKLNGLGIGYAVVRRILDILKGSIATMATLDDGCTYKFTIPYKKGKQNKMYHYKKGIGSKPLVAYREDLSPISENKESWEVNLTYLLEECMGEIDLLEELIGLFKQNMLDFIGRANVYIPEGNLNRLGFAAHKVKSGLSMMRANHLYSLVDQITIGCKTHRNLPEIGRLYDQLLLAYPMVENAIDRELMFLKGKAK